MKEVELKLIDVWNSNESIKKLTDQDMAIKTSFKLVKIRELLAKEYELIDNQRKDLVKKYDPEGKKVPEDMIQSFVNDFNNFLLTETVVFPYLPKISLSSLPDEVKLTPNELQGLFFIFDDVDVVIEDNDTDVLDTKVL